MTLKVICKGNFENKAIQLEYFVKVNTSNRLNDDIYLFENFIFLVRMRRYLFCIYIFFQGGQQDSWYTVGKILCIPFMSKRAGVAAHPQKKRYSQKTIFAQAHKENDVFKEVYSVIHAGWRIYLYNIFELGGLIFIICLAQLNLGLSCFFLNFYRNKMAAMNLV